MPKKVIEQNMQRSDLTREMILGQLSSSFLTYVAQYLRSLPAYVDDVERDFGLDIYERMMNDPACVSSISAIKSMILSRGPRFLSPVPAPKTGSEDSEGRAAYEKSEEIRAFVEEMCDDLQQPIEEVFSDMLDAIVFGHAVAEQTYAVKDGRLRLAKLSVKPRKNYAFVTDKYLNLMGILPVNPGSSKDVRSEDVIARDKFWALSFFPRGGDPRGRSIMRAAYNPWYLKQQVWPQYLKYLAQFGTPSIVGYLPPDVGNIEMIDSVAAEGDRTSLSPEEAMLTKLVGFANGTAIVLPNGSKLEPIQSQGDGDAFLNAIDLLDRQIAKAILIVIRVTMESQHGSRADSETAQDILGQFAQLVQRLVEVSFYRDVIQRVVAYNWGEEAARDLSPVMDLADVAQEDVIGVGNMIANLARTGFVHDSQLPGLDVKLNLPERDFEAQMAERAEERENRRMFDLNLPFGSDDERNQ